MEKGKVHFWWKRVMPIRTRRLNSRVFCNLHAVGVIKGIHRRILSIEFAEFGLLNAITSPLDAQIILIIQGAKPLHISRERNR